MRWTSLCLVLEPRKMVRPASNLRTNVQLTSYGLVPRSAGRFAEIPPGVADRLLMLGPRLSNEINPTGTPP
jgi:hypothetical protein